VSAIRPEGLNPIHPEKSSPELQAASNLPHVTARVATIAGIKIHSSSTTEVIKFSYNTLEITVFAFVYQPNTIQLVFWREQLVLQETKKNLF